MQSKAATIEEYLASLPEERRDALLALRKVIKKNLGKGIEERVQYGMIGYCIPHSVYPAGYHCDPTQPLPYAMLAAQKNHLALYLMSVYLQKEEEEWFRKAWLASGKKLDMGKSCVRFKGLADVPLDVVGEVIARTSAAQYIERYEAVLARGSSAAPSKKASSKKTGAKKAASQTAAAQRAAPKKAASKPRAAKKAGAAGKPAQRARGGS